jgi:hypothetical protein
VERAKLTKVSAQDLRKLATSPLLGSLASLFLYGEGWFDASAAEALAASPGLANLHTLELCHLGPEAVVPLLSSPHLGRLRCLELLGNGLGDLHVLGLLQEMRHLAGLAELRLTGNLITDKALQTLAVCPRLEGLRALRFQYNNLLGDEGVVALAGSPFLANLQTLELYDVRLGDAGARALLESPHLRRLTRVVGYEHSRRLGKGLKQALRERFGGSRGS